MKSTATYCVLLLCLLLFMSACKAEEPENDGGKRGQTGLRATVYSDEYEEWIVLCVKEHLLFADAVAVRLPAPYILPTRDDAVVLRRCNFGDGSERFVTSDGHTFGMPSASVTQAGQKTKYSVVGLWKRPMVLVVDF